jgi:hypothetical protein
MAIIKSSPHILTTYEARNLPAYYAEIVIETFDHSFHTLFICITCMAGFGLLFSAFFYLNDVDNQEDHYSVTTTASTRPRHSIAENIKVDVEIKIADYYMRSFPEGGNPVPLVPPSHAAAEESAAIYNSRRVTCPNAQLVDISSEL